MSNSYAINCDFSELLSGADQKKFCFGIIHEQLVLRHPLPDVFVLNAMFDKSNCISLARVRLGTKRDVSLRVIGITMESWEVFFNDIKQCTCINCKEKWAKTRALRNTIPQVKLITYSSLNRDLLGTARQIRSKPVKGSAIQTKF